MVRAPDSIAMDVFKFNEIKLSMVDNGTRDVKLEIF
jgi:hypothetical protein